VGFTGRSHRVRWQKLLQGGMSVALAATLWVVTAGTVAVQARESAGTRSVSLETLPAEARTTHQSIRSGGPFRYSKDGVVFGNRERLLPKHPRGYYREYTVPTPGASHRGARRIVCGGQVPVAPDACYYTDDHYASFRLIAQ
jgi:ribonuclease T1